MEKKLKRIIYVIILISVISISYLVNRAVYWSDLYSATYDIESKVEECLSGVREDYIYRWETHCESLDRDENCLLPADTAESYDADLDSDEKFCLEVYK